MIRPIATPVVRSVAVAVALLALLVAQPMFAQEKPKPAAPASAAEKAMMEALAAAATPGENHKLLASVAGDWTFTMTMWMDPTAPPQKYTGTGSYTPILGGRYVQTSAKAVMMGMPFEGMGINAYDNLTKQFVSSWIDNVGTSLVVMTGSYDAATRMITYRGEIADAMQPGTMVKVREVVRLIDASTHVMEWYETRGDKETKTMEIAYARKK